MYPDLRKQVISPPGGDLTSEIRAVDAMVGTTDVAGTEMPVFRMYALLEEEEIEAVKAGRPVFVELSLYTNRIPVFSLEALAGEG